MNNLREYLRLDFAKYLRPLLIQDKCEWCDSLDNLNLHHVDRFHNLLIETLLELNVNEMNNINDYPKEILYAIRDKMISKQLRSKYKTLCEHCHGKIHGIENRLDVYQEKTYNPYGNYFFLNLKSLLKLERRYIFRFLYLCCFTGYDSKLTYGNFTKGHNYMNIEDIPEVLKLRKRIVTETTDALVECKLIKIDKMGNISVNQKIMYKGFKPGGNGEINYTRFYIDFLTHMYNEAEPRDHDSYGRIFNLFKYTDSLNYNIISKDDEPMTRIQIYEALGYASNNTTRVNKYVDKGLLIYKENHYYMNPAFTYNGYLSSTLKDVELFMIS